MNFNKIDKLIYFRRKLTLQGLIKKMFWVEVHKINNYCKSDYDLEVIKNFSWGGGGLRGAVIQSFDYGLDYFFLISIFSYFFSYLFLPYS